MRELRYARPRSKLSGARSHERLMLAVFGTVTLLCLLSIETVWLDDVRLFGLSFGSPGLGLCFTMAMGYTVDKDVGGLTGLACGFLLDGTRMETLMLRPLLYFLLGWFCGLLGGRLLAHNLPSFAVFAAAGALLDMAREVVCAAYLSGSLPPFSWIFHAAVPVWLLTVLFSVPVYGLVVWESGRIINHTYTE